MKKYDEKCFVRQDRTRGGLFFFAVGIVTMMVLHASAFAEPGERYGDEDTNFLSRSLLVFGQTQQHEEPKHDAESPQAAKRVDPSEIEAGATVGAAALVGTTTVETVRKLSTEKLDDLLARIAAEGVDPDLLGEYRTLQRESLDALLRHPEFYGDLERYVLAKARIREIRADLDEYEKAIEDEDGKKRRKPSKQDLKKRPSRYGNETRSPNELRRKILAHFDIESSKLEAGDDIGLSEGTQRAIRNRQPVQIWDASTKQFVDHPHGVPNNNLAYQQRTVLEVGEWHLREEVSGTSHLRTDIEDYMSEALDRPRLVDLEDRILAQLDDTRRADLHRTFRQVSLVNVDRVDNVIYKYLPRRGVCHLANRLAKSAGALAIAFPLIQFWMLLDEPENSGSDNYRTSQNLAVQAVLQRLPSETSD